MPDLAAFPTHPAERQRENAYKIAADIRACTATIFPLLMMLRDRPGAFSTSLRSVSRWRPPLRFRQMRLEEVPLFTRGNEVLAREIFTLDFYTENIFQKMLAEAGLQPLGMTEAGEFFLLEKAARAELERRSIEV
ncbi:MAG: hypothetical protein ACFB9N_07205 [Geitlerinemataceae cyanobacterium]